VPGAQLAFMNRGGVRADPDAGPITWGELFTIHPFGNSLVTMTLTGAQMSTLLEQQWVGQTSPRILQVSGITYAWSASAPAGARVSAVVVGGAPLDPAASYRVVVNSFLAGGGDNFTVLAAGTDRVGGDVDLDALVGVRGGPGRRAGLAARAGTDHAPAVSAGVAAALSPGHLTATRFVAAPFPGRCAAAIPRS
jgi:2',3'-cyclic-nucleotide 2'-phosphodiesterase (5'-nucleotidase family)